MTEESSRIDFADVGGEPLLPPLRRHRRRQHRRLDWSPHTQGRKWTRPNSMHIYFTMGQELIWICISHCCVAATAPPSPTTPTTGLIPPTSRAKMDSSKFSQWDRSWYEFALATVLPPLCHHRRQHWQLDWSPHPLKDKSRLVKIQLNGYSFFSQWGRLIAGKYEFALVHNTDNWTNSPLSRAKMDSSKFNALTFISQ